MIGAIWLYDLCLGLLELLSVIYILTLEKSSQALYHTLPMAYVSVTKLQSLLEGEVNQTAARKIIEKMTRDGFVEAKGSKRLGINLTIK